MISFVDSRVFFGPNPYASEPVIVSCLQIDRDGEVDLETCAVRMAEAFDWWTGPSRLPQESEELFIGRYLAEWCLATLNEIRGRLHAGGAKQVDDRVIIWLGYHDIEVSHQCLGLSAKLFGKIGRQEIDSKKIHHVMNGIWTMCRANHPDYQSKILIEAAEARSIPYRPAFPAAKIWQFGWGCNSAYFMETISEEDSHIGNMISRDKSLSKRYFRSIGAPFSKHVLINDEKDLGAAIDKIGWPCVVKPIDRGQAKGVTVNIREFDGLRRAFDEARTFSQAPIMIESHVEGDVHRLLVVRGKFLAATRREPAHVIADGQTSIVDLAHAFNRERSANLTPGSYLLPAPLDDEFDSALAKQGYRRDSVPEAGLRIRLRDIPLQGTGAVNTDVTELVHPDIRFIAETLANTLSIKIAGFDFLTPDISRSYREMGAFLEMNLCPSLRGHLVNDRDVKGIAAEILGPTPARIPFILVVTREGDLDIGSSDLVADPGLGWRDRNDVGVGTVRLCVNAQDSRVAAQSLLCNKSVERIVLACSWKELIAFGMPVDHVDLSLVDGDDPDPVWMDVLRRHSNTVSPMPDPASFVPVIKQGWPDSSP